MELTREYLEPFVCERYRTDEHYRNGHIHILAAAPGTVIIGLHTPEMKTIAKQIARSEECQSVLAGLADHAPLVGEGGLSHEARMIWGLILDYVKCPINERLALIEQFLPSIDNWAICDNFCSNGKWIRAKDRETVWAWMETLWASGDPWRIRVATVLAMSNYLNDSYDRVFEAIEGLGLKEGEPYYVRMGVAWMLATALAKHENETRDYVRTSSLPQDIVRLYVRKARESFRTREVKAL